jgi:hypothetical protein
MLKILSLCTGVALLLPNIADAELVVWEGNGHGYELIIDSGGLDWDQANAAAQAMGGHLATLTSEAENDFVYDIAISDTAGWGNGSAPWYGPFLGGQYMNNEWTWITGEVWDYENWSLNEPGNNSQGHLMFMGDGSSELISNGWGDVSNSDISGSYIVEYIPSPGALVLLGLAGLRSRRRS